MNQEDALMLEADVKLRLARLNDYLYKETNAFVYTDRKPDQLLLYLGEHERELLFYNSYDFEEGAVTLRYGQSFFMDIQVVPVDLKSYVHVTLKGDINM